MGQGVGVVGVDSHLVLGGRARQVLVVGLHPTLALGLPALVDRPQILVESLATGSQTASLTDSVKERQAAVLILAQTMLKLAAPPVAGVLIVRQPATKLSAPAQEITLVTHSFRVGHSLQRTFADQIPAVLTHTANLGSTTGQGKIDRCAFAMRGTEEMV